MYSDGSDTVWDQCYDATADAASARSTAPICARRPCSAD